MIFPGAHKLNISWAQEGGNGPGPPNIHVAPPMLVCQAWTTNLLDEHVVSLYRVPHTEG
jgi:hypothetical protein